MKIKFLLFLTLLVTACGRMAELPVYDTPQPSGQPELDQVPDKLIGTYESLVDSGLLLVTKKGIIIKNVFSLNVAISELDSSERINLKDTVYREGKGSMTVTVTRDSVFQRNLSFDTLYYDSDKFSMKKADGYFYCNQRSFRDKWLVRTLRISDMGILVSRLHSKDDLVTLKDYSQIEPDSISYRIPTIEGLQQFLTDEKFREEWKFVRIEYGLQHKL
jgi:hypothetical protein